MIAGFRLTRKRQVHARLVPTWQVIGESIELRDLLAGVPARPILRKGGKLNALVAVLVAVNCVPSCYFLQHSASQELDVSCLIHYVLRYFATSCKPMRIAYYRT